MPLQLEESSGSALTITCERSTVALFSPPAPARSRVVLQHHYADNNNSCRRELPV